jgi:hypothetical protein
VYYWFWEFAGLALLHYPFWISVIVVLVFWVSLVFYEETLAVYILVAVVYVFSVVLIAFHLFTLYGYVILYGIDWWEVAEVIMAMMETDNFPIYPVVMILLATVSLYIARIYSGDECEGELAKICAT